MRHQVKIFCQQLKYEKMGIWRCWLWKLEVTWATGWYICQKGVDT